MVLTTSYSVLARARRARKRYTECAYYLLRAAAEAAGFDLGDGAVDRLVIIVQPRLPIVENSAERTLLVEINQRHGELDDLESGSRGLHPNLQRHRVARLHDVELPQGVNAVALEPAKRIGEIQAEAAVQLGRDLLIDLSSLGR